MSRKSIARFLLQKLLGGMIITLLVFWLFPILNVNWTTMHFYEFFSWITGALLVSSAISYVLLPPELRIKEKLKLVKTRKEQ